MQRGETADVIVVGGAMFGSAIAYGLVRAGLDVIVLDEGDTALRAARGNFGLVWVQSKGLGMHPYHQWSRESARLWNDFAPELKENSGIDVAHQNAGGLQFMLSEAELATRRADMAQMRKEAGAGAYDVEIISREDAQEMLPDIRIGDSVVAASFCRHDGHVNPLLLFHALHTAITRSGGRYRSGRRVEAIRHDGHAFVAETAAGPVAAPKIVLGAGHGAPRLGQMVGLTVPTRPQSGQILITERLRPLFRIPVSHVRQTNEGTLQLGNSAEENGYDDSTRIDITREIARRAVLSFPMLRDVRLVRTWGCVRVLTPDGAAIYDESQSHPGAYVATSHSGITLAAINARYVAGWIATGAKQPGFDRFSARRFDVQAAA